MCIELDLRIAVYTLPRRVLSFNAVLGFVAAVLGVVRGSSWTVRAASIIFAFMVVVGFLRLIGLLCLLLSGRLCRLPREIVKSFSGASA